MDTCSDEEAEPGVGSVASSATGEDDIESSRVKQKDLRYLKFPALPENAGAFRSLRNSVLPMIRFRMGSESHDANGRRDS